MQKFTAILTAIATITIASPALANTADAQQYAQAAWDTAATQQWDTAAYFFQQAIENTEDACWRGYYQDHLAIVQIAAQEAKNLNPRDAYLHWEQAKTEIVEDCW